MIPNKNSTRQVTDKLNGEEIVMGLDPMARQHLMDVLTNLYSDQPLAVVREYATNARDSHIEAGQDRPIEVELPDPDADECLLTIRDYGIGLAKQDIVDIYSLYGASTKRESNEVTGFLGLGCKSALTYTDQFTVIGTKDEVRTVVAVGRSEDGSGVMTVVSEDEAPYADNGVEVIIPVDYYDSGDFETAARDIFRFWPEGSVLVDGEAPERLSGAFVTDQIQVFSNTELYEDFLVMGGVAYEVRFSVPGIAIVAEIGMGDVEPAPSRESLQQNGLYRETVKRVKAEFEANRHKALQATIDLCSSKQEALACYARNKFLAPDAKPTFRGEEVPTRFEYPGMGRNQPMIGLKEFRPNAKGYGQGVSFPMEQGAQAGQAIKGLWITGYNNLNWGVNNRLKLDGFVQARQAQGKLAGLTTEGTIITERPDVPNADWLDPERIITWAEIKKFKINPVARGSNPAARVAGTYGLWDEDGGYFREKAPAEDIDTSKPIYYVESYDGARQTSAVRQLNEVDPGGQLVEVRSHRLKKFKRLFPTAQDFYVAVEAGAQEWWNNLTDENRRWVRWDRRKGIADHFSDEDAELILDPVIRELLTMDEHRVNTDLYPYLKKSVSEITIGDELAKRYPLLAAIPVYRVGDAGDHAIDYVNLIFTQEIRKARSES